MPFGLTTKSDKAESKSKSDEQAAANDVQKKGLKGMSFAEGEQAVAPVQMDKGKSKGKGKGGDKAADPAPADPSAAQDAGGGKDKKGLGSKLRGIGSAIAGGYGAVGGALHQGAEMVGEGIRDTANAAGESMRETMNPQIALEREDHAALSADPEFGLHCKTIAPETASSFIDDQFSYWHGKEKDRVERALNGAQQAGLSYDHVRCLVGYTSPAYVPMNRLLRGQMKSKAYTKAWKPICDNATTALKKLNGNNTQERSSLRGWRTVPNADPNVVRSAYGKEFITESAFMSTTVRAGAGAFEGPVEVRVKGVSGARVEDFSITPSEAELLYPPGMRFHVDKLTENADVADAWIKWHKDVENTKKGKMPPAAPTVGPWFVVELSEPRNAKATG